MLYQNSQELITFLQAQGLWNKKSLGQNFLVNLEVLTQIIAAAEIKPEDYVVEIGPGLGVLTEKLAEKAQHVKTIEFDARLIPILQKEFQKYPHIELILNDALKEPLPTVPYKLVANIPYYITSPLLNHYLQPQTSTEKRPSVIVLLVQKEVAEKICAKPTDQSVLSLEVQIFGKPKIMGIVNKSSFFPAPQVDSAILKIDLYPEPLIKNVELFFKLIKATFSQRRKTILNSLGNHINLTRDQRVDILEKTGIEENRRPQTLSIEEWQKLIEYLESIH